MCNQYCISFLSTVCDYMLTEGEGWSVAEMYTVTKNTKYA